jgi:hypothetical protein
MPNKGDWTLDGRHAPRKCEQTRANASQCEPMRTSPPNQQVAAFPLGQLQGRAVAKQGQARSKDGQAKSLTLFPRKSLPDKTLRLMTALMDAFYSF